MLREWIGAKPAGRRGVIGRLGESPEMIGDGAPQKKLNGDTTTLSLVL